MARRLAESTEIRHFSHLARLLLIFPVPGATQQGSMKMARIESLTFTVSFLMIGLLSFVALPLGA